MAQSGSGTADTTTWHRVLLVGPVPPELGSDNRGGVARVLWTQAKLLRDNGHEVSVLAVGRYVRGDQRAENVEVIGLRLTISALLRSLVTWVRRQRGVGAAWTMRDRLYLLYVIYRLYTVKDLDEYDVVHTHGPYNTIPTAMRAMEAVPPVLLTIHSYHPILYATDGEKERLKQLYADVADSVDGLTHVSHSDRERGRKLGIEWSCPDWVIHNSVTGVGTREWTDLADRSGVCFVGSLIKRKGLLELLAVWLEDPPGGATLTIVGSGPLQADVETAAARSPKVEYVGYLEPDKVRAVLGRAMCLAVPSYSESFGLVYLEALREGSPAVGYHRTVVEIADALQCSGPERDYLQALDLSFGGSSALRRSIENAMAARRADQDGDVARRLARKVERTFGGDRMVAELESVYYRLGSGEAPAQTERVKRPDRPGRRTS